MDNSRASDALCRVSDGILQTFRWTVPEVQMDNSRGSKGLLQHFRWTFAEVQVDNCRDFSWAVAKI